MNVLQNTLTGLKNRMINDEITVQNSSGDAVSVKFLFNPAAFEEDIQNFIDSYQVILPPDYREFLLTHNGATLFSMYGGGFLLLSLKEIREIMGRLGDVLPKGWYPVSYLDGEMLFINSNEVDASNRNTNYLYWSLNDKQKLNFNFEIWFLRFIQASGEHFWQWHYYSAENFYRLCI